MMRRRLFGAAAALAACVAAPTLAQTVAITGGRLVIGDGSPPIDQGTVVIRDGRILAAGANVAVPPGAQRIDASGKWVTPGLIAAFSRLALAEVDGGATGANDTTTRDGPFSAAIDVVPALNPRATHVANNRADGITRAVVAPGAGRSIFGGQGAIIDLGEDMDPVMRARAFQFVVMGEDGAIRAGGSRAGAATLLRNALIEAQQLRGVAGARRDDVLLSRLDAAALGAVVRGEQLLLVQVERASDILSLLRLRQEFPRLRLALVGASEGWMVADQIARAGIWVIASGLNNLPSGFDRLAATQSNIGRMRAAGVKVALGMVDDNETRMIRNGRQYAGNLVALQRVPGASGLSWGEAFALVSARPAEAFGLGHEVGSLRPGRRGDVVIWSGDPLDTASEADAVWIDGVQQALNNRQRRLRDRYRSLAPASLPEAYRK